MQPYPFMRFAVMDGQGRAGMTRCQVFGHQREGLTVLLPGILLCARCKCITPAIERFEP